MDETTEGNDRKCDECHYFKNGECHYKTGSTVESTLIIAVSQPVTDELYAACQKPPEWFMPRGDF